MSDDELEPSFESDDDEILKIVKFSELLETNDFGEILTNPIDNIVLLLRNEFDITHPNMKKLIKTFFDKEVNYLEKIKFFIIIIKSYKNLNKTQVIIIKEWMRDYIVKDNHENLLLLIKSKIAKLKFLSWTGNSCYIDSLFVALFLNNNEDINRCFFSSKKEKHLMELQQEFIKIRNYIRNTDDKDNMYCTNFREVIKTYSKDFYAELRDSQIATRPESLKFGDPTELLYFLYHNFNCNGMKFIVTNEGWVDGEKVLTSQYEHNIAPIIHIRRHFLTSGENHLQKFLNYVDVDKEHEYKNYEKTITYKGLETTNQHKIDNLNFLSFCIEKDARHMNYIINPPVRIEKLELSSVVVYTPNHYICYFLYNGNWYLYNDMNSDIKEIGDYDNLMAIDLVKKQGVIYTYMTKS